MAEVVSLPVSTEVRVSPADVAHRNDPNAHPGLVDSHDQLGDLESDTHPQYALADGSRGEFAVDGHDHNADYATISHSHPVSTGTIGTRQVTSPYVVISDDAGIVLEVDGSTLEIPQGLPENMVVEVFSVANGAITVSGSGTVTLTNFSTIGVGESAVLRHRGNTNEWVMR